MNLSNDTNASFFNTVYSYKPFARNDKKLYLAGVIPKVSVSELYAYGKCGAEVSLEQAKKSAEVTVDQLMQLVLSSQQEGEEIDRVLRLTIYISVSPDFSEISEVADAASNHLIALLGKEKGEHPRSVIGVSYLPRNSPILIEADVLLA